MANQHNDRKGALHPADHTRRHSGSRSRPVPPFAEPRPAAMFRASDGCIDELARWHRAYLAGQLSDEECTRLDEHLIRCRRCENHWDARTALYEEAQVEDGAPERSESDTPITTDHDVDDTDPEFPVTSARAAQQPRWAPRAKRRKDRPIRIHN